MKVAKLMTLGLYIAGVIAWFTPVFGDASPYIYKVAAVVPVLHVLEMAIAMPYLKRHPGGLGQSILLCLLFGVAHWIPLKKAADASAA